MNRFLKLLNFEVSRFILIFSIMMGILISWQLVSARYNAKNYVNNALMTMKNNGYTFEEYVYERGPYTMNAVIETFSFIRPILFCIAVLVIYVFFIWDRDWLGKATFSYRLLMLPTNRMNIFFAKLLTILLFIFTALAIEVGVIYTLKAWIPNIVPPELYQAIDINSILAFDFYHLLFPTTVKGFIFNYFIGTAIVTIIFTLILFERSYRLKGIVFGILFAVLCLVIILIPVIYQEITMKLFSNELYALTFVAFVITFVMSLFTSKYLLKDKINI